MPLITYDQLVTLRTQGQILRRVPYSGEESPFAAYFELAACPGMWVNGNGNPRFVVSSDNTIVFSQENIDGAGTPYHNWHDHVFTAKNLPPPRWVVIRPDLYEAIFHAAATREEFITLYTAAMMQGEAK